MTEEIKREVVSCLKKNVDIFAWTPADIPGISLKVISHHLNVDPSIKPIKQKRRNMPPEKKHALEEEIDKLIQADFIEEVQYPEWLANVVMVKKSNRKWRVCVDFTNLNKACPKVSYTLPRIDKLVDETSGYELLSFMDALSGYHQIKLNPSDKEKTAFIAKRGPYCYKVMPFGLKNAGATYQRMVNKVFKHLLGDTMEAYVDDMIIKSKTLRGGKNFEWTSECDKAFEELKEYLKQIPFLTRPEPKEPLFVYLGVSKMALRAVLLRREGKVDKPVYYVSKVLQGAESRYPFTERILQRPEYSGRLTKWVIKLGEYDICFEPRQAIKGRALADFIVECTGEEKLNKADEHIWKMFVNGASSSSGSGAGEYEALIARMSLAKQLQVKRLMAHSDSQLVVQQFHGEYEAKEPIIRQYLHKVKTLSKEFEEFQLLQVNRNSNSHAYALSKLASSMETKGRIVHLKEVQKPSIEKKNIANIEDGNDWRIPFKKFLKDGELPSNTLEAKKLKMRAAHFTLINGVLYKKGLSMPLLRCLQKQDAEYALAKVHEEICGQHMGVRALAAKVLRAGFYWPTLRDDASKKVKKCDKCQRFAPIQKALPQMFEM
ncbi:uncharacterized protein LOC120265065 [Dioscorea cayenensis subsp. rotundata]|uniref:Uncharacterized protein LOC120265065 n=1 Tax=Dioscorea cayennensis subsp. rotundata TaxID=55577 RepID=A0AB40BP36_DIOCR|nr:uncharacterized protein LOC120265065 [Dioscorea cayenensis subsp. rotundata]